MSTPLNAPSIPACGHRFNRREHMFITYETDWDALRAVVPEPLELVDRPLVRFEVMSMPDTTGYGAYYECGQAIPVAFQGEEGEYLHLMVLDGFGPMAGGREAHGYPKKPGYPKLFVDGETLVGTCDIGPSRQRIATATMTYKYWPMDEAEARRQIGSPTFMLKLQPYYDGTPRIAEIIRAQTTDMEILEAWTGEARLDLRAHVFAPLADLPVRRIVSCAHILTNLTLGQPVCVHDYLKK
jgi:acetoacetate decarboxylase